MKPRTISTLLTIVITVLIFGLFFSGHSETGWAFVGGVMLGMKQRSFRDRALMPQLFLLTIKEASARAKARGAG